MPPFRFSPIKNQAELAEAIKYTHLKCFELCKNTFGRYLPVAGNIGIFCHEAAEYEFLTKLREELTDANDNWNKKYYRLHQPISVSPQGEVPGAVYSYLYIRQPDETKPQVGDLDFVLDKAEYNELKNSLLADKQIKDLKVLDRPDLDLLELADPEVDALAFIGTKDMTENIKAGNK